MKLSVVKFAVQDTTYNFILTKEVGTILLSHMVKNSKKLFEDIKNINADRIQKQLESGTYF